MGCRRTFAFWIAAVTVIALSGVAANSDVVEETTRVVHWLHTGSGRPSGLVWVVQLSDLHFSVFHPERAEALQKLMGKVLAMIHPSLVLVTGDLTDAKNRRGTSTKQFKEEWVTYENSMNVISEESGIPLSLFYDLRGNHDKYGVPSAQSNLDYYSRYSCNARQNRTGLVHSITFLDESGSRKNLFVGVDDSMSVGLRGPSNLFGHPSDNIITMLDKELSQWDNDTSVPVTKIVFGHFPMSFTAASESGRRLEDIMSKHNISAYICGHLHCKFGRKLYKHHLTKGLGEFWEWEMGDWRVNRMMRVLVVDHGLVSFVDVDFRQLSKDFLKGNQPVMPTIILPTSPLDSRVMLDSTSGPEDETQPGKIRALVFSTAPPTAVFANLFDSEGHSFVDYILMESIKMHLVSGPAKADQGGPFVYESMWERQNYTDPSATRFWLQILALHTGVTTTSNMQPFSVAGKRSSFSLTVWGYFGMGIKWERVFPVVLWTIICVILGGLLILPRLGVLYLEWNGIYDGLGYAIFHPPPDSKFPYLKLPLWALLEGARNRYLWWAQVLYISFLLVLPWFWGRVLADDYPMGYMTIWGWTVWPSKGTVAHQSGLGWPDIMGIVLPYMCAVVLPLVLMISALCAEQGACEIVRKLARNSEGPVEPQVGAKKTNGGGTQSNIGLGRLLNGSDGSESEDGRPLLESDSENHSADQAVEASSEDAEGESKVGRKEWTLVERKIRIAYFIGCVLVAYSHLRLCLYLASSYGAQAVLLSPIYVWFVPTLMVVSIVVTSPVKVSKS